MHVCQYKGKDHLCFFQGIQQNGYCRGHGVIMDSQYRIVKTVTPGGGIASSDMHEFKPINDGKTALMTVYQQRQFDMSLWNVKTGMGWLMESIFQEVDVETNEVLFEWNSLDHVDPSASFTYPGATDTSGTGFEARSPWDYFHINSVDKNRDGDYLISSRHTCAIYKISGRDGSIIWQLHGANPTFQNLNFSFSQQHDARWLSENGTHTLLTLYNNGYNGFNQTHGYSSGMTILINHVNQTAEQLHDYAPPGQDMLSSSQGNMQTLSNGNVFIGWGNNAYISEHDANGELLLWGYLDKERIMNYRAQKFHWDGMPTDVPALWTYSPSTEAFAPTTFYASWNGATRVRSWRFYGATNRTGPYTLLKQTAKEGFETVYRDPHFYQWTYAEAVDLQGHALGQSSVKFTFTPSPQLQAYCPDEEVCHDATSYGVPGEEDASSSVPPAGINTVPWVDPEHPQAHYGGVGVISTGGETSPSPDGGSGSGSGTTASTIVQQTYRKLNDFPGSPPFGCDVSGAFRARGKLTWSLACLERVGWAGPALGVVIVAAGVFAALRIYRRRRSVYQYHSKERESTEALNETWSVSSMAERPWWHWRGRGPESAQYLPVSQPGSREV